jgi:alpha-methylacyl-CoA racemase
VLELQDAPPRTDIAGWDELRRRMAEVFRTRTRDEWVAAFDSQPACVTPVLRLGEVPDHPHVQAREAMVTHEGVVRPGLAPRFSRTPGALPPVDGYPETELAWQLTDEERSRLVRQADGR